MEETAIDILLRNQEGFDASAKRSSLHVVKKPKCIEVVLQEASGWVQLAELPVVPSVVAYEGLFVGKRDFGRFCNAFLSYLDREEKSSVELFNLTHKYMDLGLKIHCSFTDSEKLQLGSQRQVLLAQAKALQRGEFLCIINAGSLSGFTHNKDMVFPSMDVYRTGSLESIRFKEALAYWASYFQ